MEVLDGRNRLLACDVPCTISESRSSRQLLAGQNVPARNEAGPLEGLAAGSVFRIAPRRRDAPALVTDALQFLNQVRADAAPPERLTHGHVNVAVGPVVMEQDVPSPGNDASDHHQPAGPGIQLLLGHL